MQTEADRSAQKCIIASLSKHFPNIHIIGEEESNNDDVPPEWIVSDSDKNILQMQCPKELSQVTDKEVRKNNYKGCSR